MDGKTTSRHDYHALWTMATFQDVLEDSSSLQSFGSSLRLFIWSCSYGVVHICMGCSYGAGPINRDDLFNKDLITALINIQNDISNLNRQ
jgi:hypothetical protein